MPSELRCKSLLKGHKGSVFAVTFNSDGNYCLSAGDDRRVLLWNPRREEADIAPIKEYRGVNNYRILDLAIAHDNSTFASCGGDKAVLIWDVTSGRVLRHFNGHTQRVNAVAYNLNESSVLISGSYDTTVRCWDCRSRSNSPIQVLDDAADSVTSVAVSGHELMSASVDGVLRCYDLRKRSLTIDTVSVPLLHVALSLDGHCALAAGLDSTIRLFNKATGAMLCQYTGHQNENFKLACAFSHDDALVLSGSEDGSLHIWDLVNSKQLVCIPAHSGALFGLACHPKRFQVLTAAADGLVKLWCP
mgnify:CR=1 FL=1|jgi:mitogen-activated protein kinase organizer 1|tara:strand:- start:553 stop:1461 length:909 start_codon:yes stop_codon:yes gene_type:complete